MFDILKNIEDKKSELQTLLKNKNNVKVLEKWLKCELSYTSNAIEGNTLTRKETARIIEEKITSSSKPFVYYQEAINHSLAFNYLLECIEENGLEINENIVLNLHKFILCNIDNNNAGFYRNCMVRISGSRVVLPNCLKVPKLMSSFFEELKTMDINNPLTAIWAHYKIVSIHPFVDGNGRCARLFMNLLLMKAGFAPIIIRPSARKRYLNSLEKGQLSEDTTSYTAFMLSMLNLSLNAAIDLIRIPENDICEKDLLKISEVAKLLDIRPSAIRYWVKNNKVTPYKYTQSGYMLFSKKQVSDIKKIIKNK